MSIKRISFVDQHDELEIYIKQVLDAAYGCYIWPSSLVMSEFVWSQRRQFLNKTVLEVGAGTCLPSLLLGKYSTSIQLIVSDIPAILPVMQDCLELNKVQAQVKSIEWGRDSLHVTVDYIIGSDTFYDPSEFENLLVFVAEMVEKNPECKFYTTYQERSMKRSIQYLLDKWGLSCDLVQFDFDETKYTNENPHSQVKVNSGTLSSIFLLEIKK